MNPIPNILKTDIGFLRERCRCVMGCDKTLWLSVDPLTYSGASSNERAIINVRAKYGAGWLLARDGEWLWGEHANTRPDYPRLLEARDRALCVGVIEAMQAAA